MTQKIEGVQIDTRCPHCGGPGFTGHCGYCGPVEDNVSKTVIEDVSTRDDATLEVLPVVEVDNGLDGYADGLRKIGNIANLVSLAPIAVGIYLLGHYIATGMSDDNAIEAYKGIGVGVNGLIIAGIGYLAERRANDLESATILSQEV